MLIAEHGFDIKMIGFFSQGDNLFGVGFIVDHVGNVGDFLPRCNQGYLGGQLSQTKLVDLAVGNGYEPTQKEKVEPMTLKALYRERVEAGLDMPSDIFHLYMKDETKMKR